MLYILLLVSLHLLPYQCLHSSTPIKFVSLTSWRQFGHVILFGRRNGGAASHYPCQALIQIAGFSAEFACSDYVSGRRVISATASALRVFPVPGLFAFTLHDVIDANESCDVLLNERVDKHFLFGTKASSD